MRNAESLSHVSNGSPRASVTVNRNKSSRVENALSVFQGLSQNSSADGGDMAGVFVGEGGRDEVAPKSRTLQPLVSRG
jgi:hypothetical protein